MSCTDEDIQNNNKNGDDTRSGRHPMLTRRRRSGLYNIFDGIPEDQILNLRRKFGRRGSGSKDSRTGSSDDVQNGGTDGADATSGHGTLRRSRSQTLDDTEEEPARMRRKSGSKDRVSSGRVTKATSGRQRRFGVVGPKPDVDAGEDDVMDGDKNGE